MVIYLDILFFILFFQIGNGKVLRDFYKTRTEAQVTETLLSFSRSQIHILVSGHKNSRTHKQSSQHSLASFQKPFSFLADINKLSYFTNILNTYWFLLGKN